VYGIIGIRTCRVLDPDGHGLAPITSVKDVVSETLRTVKPLVTPACAIEDLHLTRLDIARDFEGVENPAGTIKSLVPMPRKRATSVSLNVNPRGSASQTLSVCSGNAGMVRLYDKCA